MVTISLPKKLFKEEDLVAIPRKKYEQLLDVEKLIVRVGKEDASTQLALKIYKQEKRFGKLKTLTSLAALK